MNYITPCAQGHRPGFRFGRRRRHTGRPRSPSEGRHGWVDTASHCVHCTYVAIFAVPPWAWPSIADPPPCPAPGRRSARIVHCLSHARGRAKTLRPLDGPQPMMALSCLTPRKSGRATQSGRGPLRPCRWEFVRNPEWPQALVRGGISAAAARIHSRAAGPRRKAISCINSLGFTPSRVMRLAWASAFIRRTRSRRVYRAMAR